MNLFNNNAKVLKCVLDYFKSDCSLLEDKHDESTLHLFVFVKFHLGFSTFGYRNL